MPYPSPPGKRIAYDIDGSVGMAQNSETREWFDIHPRALKALNNERSGGSTSTLLWKQYGTDTGVFVIFFPVPMRIRGLMSFTAHVVSRGNSTDTDLIMPKVSFSSDSTNGDDGTFVTAQPDQRVRRRDSIWAERDRLEAIELFNGDKAVEGFGYATGPALNDEYRRSYQDIDNPGVVSVSGAHTRNVRAVRVDIKASYASYSFYPHASHLFLYGEPDTDAVENRLSFWRPDVDATTTPDWLDWGDVPVSSTATKSFRVRNMSTSSTATNILIRAQPGATTAPPPEGFITFSMDGGSTWTTTVDIAAMSPQTISPVILVRRVVPSNAELSNWSPRITAETGVWV